jgi:hypothetical protein
MNNEIDVCFLHAGTELETYALENLIKQTKQTLNVYCEKIGESYADSMNSLISKGKSDKLVIFPSNLLVNENWLEELLHYQQLIVNPGCVGLYDYTLMHKIKSHRLLNIEDKLTTIWTTDNYVEGVMLMNRNLITEEIGIFDKLFDKTGYEQIQFTTKFAFAGHNNFYIRCHSTTSLKIQDREELFVAKNKWGNELMTAFVKANINFKKELLSE